MRVEARAIKHAKKDNLGQERSTTILKHTVLLGGQLNSKQCANIVSRCFIRILAQIRVICQFTLSNLLSLKFSTGSICKIVVR